MAERRTRRRTGRSVGGVGDGLPALPNGEPLLARWFVLAMLVLGLVAVTLTVVFLSTRVEPVDEAFPVAERRPPGTTEVTHDRGRIVLAEDTTSEQPVTCAENVRLVGDDGGRSTLQRAFGVLCAELASPGDGALGAVAEGLDRFDAAGGIARVALGEATGVDSSLRVEDGELVLEIAPKFQFDNGRLAAPFLAHELAHLAGGWPEVAVDAEDEVTAMAAQLAMCEAVLERIDAEAPRGCRDAQLLLEGPDPAAALRDAGYE